jgi:hypothetical protein
MKHKQAKIIVGGAITAAAIAVAIDHSKQRLPEPEDTLASQQAVIIIEEGDEIPAENTGDCNKTKSTKRAAPCSL